GWRQSPPPSAMPTGLRPTAGQTPTAPLGPRVPVAPRIHAVSRTQADSRIHAAARVPTAPLVQDLAAPSLRPPRQRLGHRPPGGLAHWPTAPEARILPRRPRRERYQQLGAASQARPLPSPSSPSELTAAWPVASWPSAFGPSAT